MDDTKNRQAAAEAVLIEKMTARIASAGAGQAEKLARDLLADFKAAGGAFYPWRRTGRSM